MTLLIGGSFTSFVTFSLPFVTGIVHALEIIKKVIHVGYIPLILYIGITRSEPRPSIIRLISPFA
ncbi:hypothetical protein HMI56_000902 [Coelomomyces lativittatus]|nr:hypothetical protein HMI56_000902 [Coelomomyces lativittatus]